jgi:hypothetical protein
MFKRTDPFAALTKAREHLAAADARAAALRAEREQALLQFEGVDEVAKLDAAIAAQERSAAIHRDRIAALEGEAKHQASEQIEAARAAALERISKKLDARNEFALKIEQATRHLADLYAAMGVVDCSLRADWALPMAGYWAPDAGIAGEVLGLLHRQTRAKSAGLFPRSMWRDLNAVIGVDGIAAKVASQNEQLLDALRNVPIEPNNDADVAEPEAA